MSAFDRAAPWLMAALYAQDKRPLWTLYDVRAELEARNAHLWLGDRSGMVTTISDYPGAGERIIECWLAGGDGAEIAQTLRPAVEDWAKRVGCTQAHVTGRRGWVRRLAPFGYEHYATTVRKLLS